MSFLCLSTCKPLVLSTLPVGSLSINSCHLQIEVSVTKNESSTNQSMHGVSTHELFDQGFSSRQAFTPGGQASKPSQKVAGYLHDCHGAIVPVDTFYLVSWCCSTQALLQCKTVDVGSPPAARTAPSCTVKASQEGRNVQVSSGLTSQYSTTEVWSIFKKIGSYHLVTVGFQGQWP